MKHKFLFTCLLLAGGVVLAAEQTAAPKDPPLIDAQGYQKILEKYKGQPLLVNFWATWCEPCRDEYPMLNDLAKQYAPQGLKVVGVDMDQDGDLILMRRFLARYKPIFPNYRKMKGDESGFPSSVMPGWNGSLPATFIYAKDGSQAGHFIGAQQHDTYDAAIRSVLAK
jgi:thiol-disulfide isomerase/thioredoxin